MIFLTRAQVGALAAFRPKDVDYVVVDRSFLSPGNIAATFWMQNGHHLTLEITPEGELKYV